MTSEREKKLQERENLRNIIIQWNANRLDLFELSEPNEELEFHGVMRFYFQDSGQKVATKCIRVSSTAASIDVIHTLIEKFRPDIRMLSIPEYAIYEIHENGEERKLADEEKPLLVQLNWHKDDREGRFLLRRMDEKSILPITMDPEARSFRRKLSKREKKEKKKKEKKERLKENANQENRKDGIAEKLYSELPETSFTRSISNPEAVMRRRRQQKLERKLQQFRQEGGPEAGGTLRIFGETLNKDVPYKTLLLSTRDSAAFVVKEILDKYGMDREESNHYCLVQVIIPHPMVMGGGRGGGGGADGGGTDMHEYHRGTSIREYILDDDDCPLVIEKQHNRNKGILTFHIRRRPADYQPRKRKKKSKPVKGELDNGYKSGEDLSSEKLPYLLELNPDGSEIQEKGAPKKHCLYLNVTEIGSERSSAAGGQHLQLFGPNVQSRHCVIAHTEGIVTVTPSSRDAETYVNGVRIYETTILQHQVILRFGKLHTFKFVDPQHDERRRMSPDPRHVEYLDRSSLGRNKDDSSASVAHHPSLGHPINSTSQPPMLPPPPGGYETTFDADGNVETISTHSRDDRISRKSDDMHSHRSFSGGGGGREGAQSRGEKHDPQGQIRRGNDPILPAVLEFWEEGEDAFLKSIIGQMEAGQVQFKLAPTYILYMAARYRASTHYRPEASPGDRAHRLTALMIKIAGLVHQVIQDRYRDGTSLAFWLANASELLHFLKQDRHVCAYTLDAQDLLAESVQLAFRSLVTCQQVELQTALPAILEDRDDLNEDEGTTGEVLGVLSGAMSLLRRCRVNAALTIQLFSQLFHHVNMWLFNHVVIYDLNQSQASQQQNHFCTRIWGIRLKKRLLRIEVWAEKQGLELAADCHLSRIVQAAHLLQSSKTGLDDIASISSACFKLNSLQLRSLLERYEATPDEPTVPRDLIENVVQVAQSTADELARSDGREVRLEEDPDLQLPFLLPEDGYSCDIVRGVPAGLQDYLQPLLHAGLCRLTIQPTSSGYWTIYMSDQDIGKAMAGTRSPSVQSSHQGDGEASGRGSALPLNEPEVLSMNLNKSNSGMGLSIVAARGVGQDKLGIYVKSVVKGGAADQDGRLQAGDQLLKVDGHSLVGISQEKAAELMTRTGPVVTLEVAKQGAIYHGLAALLSQPSPVLQRGPRRMSERDIPGRIVQEQNHVPPPRMQGSKSVPSLNSGQTGPEIGPQGVPNHEIYNPGYSRTSSTASIPKTSVDQHYPGPEIHNRHVKPSPVGASITTTDFNHPQYDPRYVPGQALATPPNSSHQGPNLVTLQPGQTGGPPVQPGPPNYSAINGARTTTQQQQQALAEERHYQNISMYQQAPGYNQYPRVGPQVHGPHQANAQQRPLHGSHSSLLRPDHLHHHHPQQQQQQQQQHQQATSQSPMDRSRPLSTLVSPREQEQYVNSLNYNNQRPGESPGPQPGSPLQRGVPQQNWNSWQEPQRSSINYGHRVDFHNQSDISEESVNKIQYHSQIDPRQQLDARHQSQMDLRPPPQQLDPRHQSQMDLRQHQQHLDPRQRDLLRQEAKMEEMREEVRRREEREHSGGPQRPNIPAGQPIWGPGGPGASNTNRSSHPGAAYGGGAQPQPSIPPHMGGPQPQSIRMGGPPPPTVPKPRQPQQQQQHPIRNSTTYEGSVEGSPGAAYRDSPPPPPPNSTHPLLQQQSPIPIAGSGPAVSYRYGPSGYPPRPGNEGPPIVVAEPVPQRVGPPQPPGRQPQGEIPRANNVLYGKQQGIQVQSQKPVQVARMVPDVARMAQVAQTIDKKEFGITSPSPWEREEKEKLRKQRLEEARRIRDNEIRELENLASRSQKQDDRLRALRLEQEFQRRAEETHGDDEEDDDELLDRAENRERILRMQEDLARTRQRRIDFEQEQQRQKQQQQRQQQQQQQQQQSQQQQMHEEWMRKQAHQEQLQLQQQRGGVSQVEILQEQEGRLRHLRLEEVTRKKELEATREAEERLLREARRRQEEDYHQGHPGYVSQGNNGLNSSGPQRLDTLLTKSVISNPNGISDMPPALPTSPPPPLDSEYHHHHHQGNSNASSQGLLHHSESGSQRLDHLVMSSAPSSSSSSITNHHNDKTGPPIEKKPLYDIGNTRYPGVLRNGDANQPLGGGGGGVSMQKKVSFHDAKLETEIGKKNAAILSTSSSQLTEDDSYTLDDIDDALDDVQSQTHLLNTSGQSSVLNTSTGSAPGVIGAQEVYRDPRQRIEAERYHNSSGVRNSNVAPPEKLTFREKMKMFALETGEDETPKDKVKISRAQREIETRTNGGAPPVMQS